MVSKILSIFIVGISISVVGVSSFACVGARPLAMGGAFVGVADDANATYWNPAGLTQLDEIQLTYTPTIYNRDTVNYDDFVSLAAPLAFSGKDWGSLGVSFVNSGYKYTFSGIDVNDSQKWAWCSYGKKLPISFLNLSLGANLRWLQYSFEARQGALTAEDKDDTFALDLALFWKWSKFSFGVLYQDVNEPEVTLFGTSASYIRNLRPGIAFRPDDKTIISAELYDITNESDSAGGNLRLGLERWFDLPIENSSFALRLGGYDINAENKSSRAITGGAGFKYDSPNEDYSVSVDYALLYWQDTASEPTHMLGFKVSFPWETITRAYSSLWSYPFSYNTAERPARSRKEMFLAQKPAAVKPVLPVIKNEPCPALVVDKELSLKEKKLKYYAQVYEKLNRCFYETSIAGAGKVNLSFIVAQDGKITDIEVDSDSFKVSEIVRIILDKIAYFEQIPPDLGQKKLKFALNIDFSS